MSRPVIANDSDPVFRELVKFLNIPPGTMYYRLEFVANEVVTVESKFELEVREDKE